MPTLGNFPESFLEMVAVEGPCEMVEGYGPHPPVVIRCTICGSMDVEDESFESFGGTSEGYEHCNDCGAHWSWCDMSAVI